MGSVGDVSHDAVAKELREEGCDLQTEVHDVDEGLAGQNAIGVQEAHKTEVLEAEAVKAEVDNVEGSGTQNSTEVPESEKAAAQEAEIQEPDVPEDDVVKAAGPITQHPIGVEEAQQGSVVNELSRKLSAVTVAAADARDQDVSEPVPQAAVEEVLPAVKRKLPEVKRFSARRSATAEGPNFNRRDDSMAPSPSTMRGLRSVQKHSNRTSTGIDDRDTVDYTVEEAKPVVKKEALAVASPKQQQQQLSVEERERLRLLAIKRKKDFVCLERIQGKLKNITEGLELHTGVFSRVEQKKLVDLVKDLQAKGRRQELKERTYSEPRKWMRGKGRVTLQFGCCYNYAIDKFNNPPGILREDVVDPIPPLLRTTIKRLVRWHVLPPSCIPDSCIINIYEEGDCIPPHIDHHDFLRPFCTLSLVSECSIVFGANLEIVGPGDFAGTMSLPLPVGSVLVLNGNGADVAKHAVPAVPTDRVSITFRKMDPSKVPRGFAVDQGLQNLKPVPLPS